MRSIVLVFFLLLLFGCVEQNNGPSFYEIVNQREECDPYCSLEFIVLSNGIVLKKQSISSDFSQNTIELVDIGKEKAIKAIEFTQQNVTEVKDSRCVNCNDFHVFLIKDGQTIMYLEEEENSPEFIKKIFEDSKQLFSQGSPSQDFFVQFVYQRRSQNIIDYHIFSDGTLLKGEFGIDSALKKAELSILSKEKLDSLKSKITTDYFTSTSSIANCNQKNMQYGYLDIKKDGKHNFVWTCGAENSVADQLFNDFLAELG